jgi:hypothetical protein
MASINEPGATISMQGIIYHGQSLGPKIHFANRGTDSQRGKAATKPPHPTPLPEGEGRIHHPHKFPLPEGEGRVRGKITTGILEFCG